MRTLREQSLGEKAIISSDTLTKGWSWALVNKVCSALCSRVDHAHWFSRSA